MEEGVINIDRTAPTLSPPSPKAKYTLFIYGNEFQAREEKDFTEDDVNAYVKTILTDGYTTSPAPNRWIVYSPHTIKKVDVIKA